MFFRGDFPNWAPLRKNEVLLNNFGELNNDVNFGVLFVHRHKESGAPHSPFLLGDPGMILGISENVNKCQKITLFFRDFFRHFPTSKIISGTSRDTPWVIRMWFLCFLDDPGMILGLFGNIKKCRKTRKNLSEHPVT